MVFLPHDPGSRAACEQLFEKVVREEGQTFLGWRDVPDRQQHARPDRAAVAAGHHASSSSAAARDGRRRRRVRAQALRHPHAARENAVRQPGRARARPCFYIPSLSCTTIVYKGMLNADQLPQFYPDLRDPASSRRWRWSTRASAPTRSRAGRARIRTATSRTTARSTRCAATSTGCTRARACSSRELFGDDIDEDAARSSTTDGSDSAMFDNVLELLVAGRPLAAARGDDDDPRAVAEPRVDGAEKQGLLRVPLAA